MTQSQLPAHLQKYNAPDVGAALSQNLGSAMPPHVSIEGGRFTLVDASNNEIPVPTHDPNIGVYLDAAIIDVNEHMSRMYYIKDYDPSAAGAPPDCWSDNGVAASVGATSVPLLLPPHPRAGQPAATCAECPMAVWGSKVSNLGSKIPACSQKQKTALLVPGFSTLFLLAVPPNSHKFLREYVERSRGSGVNLADVITRISFVKGVQGTLQFSPVNYIDEPTAILRQAAYVEKKTDVLVGRNDVPRMAALAPPVQHVNGPYASPMLAGTGDLNQPMSAPQVIQQVPQQQVFQPAPQVQPQTFAPPAAAAPTPTASGQFPNPSATSTIPNTVAPAAGAMTASLSEPAPTTRRRRRTAAEMQAAQPGAQAPAAAQAAPQQPAPASPGQMPQAPFPHPGQAAAAPQQLDAFPAPSGAPAHPSAMPAQPQFGMASGTPVAANPEVSAMLDDFFKQG